jgi:hypothetical protein
MTLSLFFLDFIANEFLRLFPKFPYHMVTGFTMIMPTFGYLDQIRLMVLNACPDYYSMKSAEVLIASNGVKLLFWFFEPFAIPLLGQAFFLFLVPLVHTFLHFHYRNKSEEHESKIPLKNKFALPKFKSPKSYLNIENSETFTDFFISVCLYGSIIVVAFLISCFIFKVHPTVNIFSVSANVLDSTVSLPLFTKVVINSEIEHITLFLPLQYVAGDLMKFIVLAVNFSPWPFFLGAFLQTLIDSITLIVFLIKSNGQLKGNKEIIETDKNLK